MIRPDGWEWELYACTPQFDAVATTYYLPMGNGIVQ
jgi:hypothetical protein